MREGTLGDTNEGGIEEKMQVYEPPKTKGRAILAQTRGLEENHVSKNP